MGPGSSPTCQDRCGGRRGRGQRRLSLEGTPFLLEKSPSSHTHHPFFLPRGHYKVWFPLEETPDPGLSQPFSHGRTHTQCRHTHAVCRLSLHTHMLCVTAHTFGSFVCDPPGSPPLAWGIVRTSPSFFLPSAEGEEPNTNSLPPLRKTLVWGGRREEGKVSFNCHPLPSILSWTLSTSMTLGRSFKLLEPVSVKWV